MYVKVLPTLLAGSMALASLSIEATGFQEIEVMDPGFKNLNVGLWYPTDQPAPEEPNTVFGLAVAHKAPPSKTNGGLVVISHGYGGWYAGHADTAAALADAGFIVAAPSHTGNTWSDMSSSIELWAIDRPRHISKIIDQLISDDQWGARIDPEKIGIYGYSAGGYTAIGLIGGVPDIVGAIAFCEKQPTEFVCSEGMIQSMYDAGMHTLPSTAWGADSRVKAAVISAPGLAFAYTENSLSNVSADVQLWSGDLDESVPTDTNAALLAENLPHAPETHWVEGASHFAFMVIACRDAFEKEDPVEYEMVCGDPEGFDRIAFHEDMHKEMIRFYKASFGLAE